MQIRTDENKTASPDIAKEPVHGKKLNPLKWLHTERVPAQLLEVSECKVADVLEPLSDSETLELSELLNTLQPTNCAIRVSK
jgi:hypothetical protein